MSAFVENIKKLLNSTLDIGNEEKNLLRFTSSIKLSQGQIVLDIGCGYGRKMMLLRSKGFEVIGIDINPDIVKTNLEAGLNCMTLQEFDKTRNTFPSYWNRYGIWSRFISNSIFCPESDKSCRSMVSKMPLQTSFLSRIISWKIFSDSDNHQSNICHPF